MRLLRFDELVCVRLWGSVDYFLCSGFGHWTARYV